MGTTVDAEAYILAANGRPFTDQTAASIKARTLTTELGEPYVVVNHPKGGFAILRSADDVSETKTESKTSPVMDSLDEENPLIFRQRKPLHFEEESEKKQSATPAPTPVPAGVISPEKQFRTLVIRPAWRSFWKLHLLTVIGFIVAMFPYGFLTNILMISEAHVRPIAQHGMLPILSLMGLVSGLTGIAYAVYGRYVNRYTITPETVEWSYGIIARKVVRAEYTHIRSIEVEQGIIDVMINVGKLEVATAATADAEVIFAGIANPMYYKDEVAKRRKYGRQSRMHEDGE